VTERLERKRKDEDANVLQNEEETETFQYVETYSAKSIDIRVIYLGEESNLRGGHRVILRKEKFQFEHTALVRGLGWTVYGYVKVSKVVIVRDCADAGNSE